MNETEPAVPPSAGAHASRSGPAVGDGKRTGRQRVGRLSGAIVLACLAIVGILVVRTDTSSSSPRTPAKSPVAGGGNVTELVNVHNARANCIFLGSAGGILTPEQITSVEALTHVTYHCLEVFADAPFNWAEWADPYPTATPGAGWRTWLRSNRENQLVFGLQLIPADTCRSVCSDPAVWEQACADGQDNGYARTLGENLVAQNAGYSVIRLGKEFNGSWENDWTGQTAADQRLWAKCFDNEVASMRSVRGAHFLIDWNIASCDGGVDLADAYPGNAFVDMVGIDTYDVDCATGKTAGEEGWATFIHAGHAGSVAHIAAFARAHGKPISIPEWGLTGPDDPTYVNGIKSLLASHDSVYESYFDCGCDSVSALGSEVPNALAAYSRDFSS